MDAAIIVGAAAVAIISSSIGVFAMSVRHNAAVKTHEEIHHDSQQIPKLIQTYTASELQTHKDNCSGHKHIIAIKSALMWLVFEHPKGGPDKVRELGLDR